MALVPEAGSTGVDGFTVVKSDSTVFSRFPRAIYVGTTGDVTIRTPAGTTLLFKDVPAGGYVLCQCDQVRSTGTDAADMVAIY